MLNLELVRLTEGFLKREFEGGAFLSTHPKDKAYRLEHSYRVANIGYQIAQKEGFDETGMVIACLLHDVSYCEEFGENGWKEHGRRAAKIARPFLSGLNLPTDLVNEICYGIAIHVDDEADFPGEKTPFALSVGDADNIDRFDVYRIHEGLVHEKFLEKNYEEKLDYTKKRLARLNELQGMPLGTKAAEDLWRERLSFYITFYQKLLSQLRYSKEIFV